ncbi:OmpA family protein [Buttiauxella agrestis]|uniref:OmpA family protein n=1 Tax=Buttiauxella agrestis TaxID=82977 RepID=UPI0039758219
MNSETCFDKIICIDTLLSFDGIIPSLPVFQAKLVALIEALSQTLLTESQPKSDINALCKAICGYLDQRVEKCLGGGLISWSGFALHHYFYGYDKERFSLFQQLCHLLSTSSNKTHLYALRMLPLLRQLEGESLPLDELLDRYATPPVRGPSTLAGLNVHGTASRYKKRAQVVFILGPFAEKWFSDSAHQGAVRFDNETIWLLAPTAQTLHDRLVKIKAQDCDTQVMAFFPILPDGYESSAYLLSRLVAWCNSFSTLRLSEPLLCTLGFYGRFSNERSTHDPDRTIWVGKFVNTPDSSVSIKMAFDTLRSDLSHTAGVKGHYTSQRKAVSEALISWLGETGITEVLQTLFSTLPLVLTGAMVSDHGSGFIRHGAWAVWLEEKYGILPGLSSGIAMPALPLVPTAIDYTTPLNVSRNILSQIKPEKHYIRPVRWVLAGTSFLLLMVVMGQVDVLSSVEEDIGQIVTAVANGGKKMPLSTVLTLSAFASGVATLSPQQEEELVALMPQLILAAESKFMILGYSDNTGTPAQNLTLSRQRALNVRDWITLHSSLSPERFKILAMGDANPVSSNLQEISRADNRRVEIMPFY